MVDQNRLNQFRQSIQNAGSQTTRSSGSMMPNAASRYSTMKYNQKNVNTQAKKNAQQPHGWAAVLKNIMDSPVGKGLHYLDTGRSYVTSHVADIAEEVTQGDLGGTLRAVGDTAIGNWENADNRTAFWDHKGAGYYLEKGITKAGLQGNAFVDSNWFKLPVSIAADVAFDPLTWAGGGIHGSATKAAQDVLETGAKFAAEHGDQAAQQAIRLGLNEEEIAAVREIASKSAIKESEVLAAKLTSKGKSAMEVAEAQKYFPRKSIFSATNARGFVLKVPFTGRVAEWAGYKGEQKALQILPKSFTDKITRTLAIPRNAFGRSIVAEKIARGFTGVNAESRRLIKTGTVEQVVAGLKSETGRIRGQAYVNAGMRLLPDNIMPNGFEGGEGAARLGKKASAVWREGVKGLSAEELKGARVAIESASLGDDISNIPGATHMKDFLHEMFRVAEAEGVPMQELDDYFPRIITNDAREAYRIGKKGSGVTNPSMTNKRTILPQEGETNATVRENMQRMARDDGVAAGYYEDDVNKTMQFYINGLTRAIGKRRNINYLISEGVGTDEALRLGRAGVKAAKKGRQIINAAVAPFAKEAKAARLLADDAEAQLLIPHPDRSPETQALIDEFFAPIVTHGPSPTASGTGDFIAKSEAADAATRQTENNIFVVDSEGTVVNKQDILDTFDDPFADTTHTTGPMPRNRQGGSIFGRRGRPGPRLRGLEPHGGARPISPETFEVTRAGTVDLNAPQDIAMGEDITAFNKSIDADIDILHQEAKRILEDTGVPSSRVAQKIRNLEAQKKVIPAQSVRPELTARDVTPWQGIETELADAQKVLREAQDAFYNHESYGMSFEQARDEAMFAHKEVSRLRSIQESINSSRSGVREPVPYVPRPNAIGTRPEPQPYGPREEAWTKVRILQREYAASPLTPYEGSGRSREEIFRDLSDAMDAHANTPATPKTTIQPLPAIDLGARPADETDMAAAVAQQYEDAANAAAVENAKNRIRGVYEPIHYTGDPSDGYFKSFVYEYNLGDRPGNLMDQGLGNYRTPVSGGQIRTKDLMVSDSLADRYQSFLEVQAEFDVSDIELKVFMEERAHTLSEVKANPNIPQDIPALERVKIADELLKKRMLEDGQSLSEYERLTNVANEFLNLSKTPDLETGISVRQFVSGLAYNDDPGAVVLQDTLDRYRVTSQKTGKPVYAKGKPVFKQVRGYTHTIAAGAGTPFADDALRAEALYAHAYQMDDVRGMQEAQLMAEELQSKARIAQTPAPKDDLPPVKKVKQPSAPKAAPTPDEVIEARAIQALEERYAAELRDLEESFLPENTISSKSNLQNDEAGFVEGGQFEAGGTRDEARYNQARLKLERKFDIDRGKITDVKYAKEDLLDLQAGHQRRALREINGMSPNRAKKFLINKYGKARELTTQDVSRLTEGYNARLNRAIADGRITKTEAEWALKVQTNKWNLGLGDTLLSNGRISRILEEHTAMWTERNGNNFFRRLNTSAWAQDRLASTVVTERASATIDSGVGDFAKSSIAEGYESGLYKERATGKVLAGPKDFDQYSALQERVASGEVIYSSSPRADTYDDIRMLMSDRIHSDNIEIATGVELDSKLAKRLANEPYDLSEADQDFWYHVEHMKNMTPKQSASYVKYSLENFEMSEDSVLKLLHTYHKLNPQFDRYPGITMESRFRAAELDDMTRKAEMLHALDNGSIHPVENQFDPERKWLFSNSDKTSEGDWRTITEQRDIIKEEIFKRTSLYNGATREHIKQASRAVFETVSGPGNARNSLKLEDVWHFDTPEDYAAVKTAYDKFQSLGQSGTGHASRADKYEYFIKTVLDVVKAHNGTLTDSAIAGFFSRDAMNVDMLRVASDYNIYLGHPMRNVARGMPEAMVESVYGMSSKDVTQITADHVKDYFAVLANDSALAKSIEMEMQAVGVPSKLVRSGRNLATTASEGLRNEMWTTFDRRGIAQAYLNLDDKAKMMMDIEDEIIFKWKQPESEYHKLKPQDRMINDGSDPNYPAGTLTAKAEARLPGAALAEANKRMASGAVDPLYNYKSIDEVIDSVRAGSAAAGDAPTGIKTGLGDLIEPEEYKAMRELYIDPETGAPYPKKGEPTDIQGTVAPELTAQLKADPVGIARIRAAMKTKNIPAAEISTPDIEAEIARRAAERSAGGGLAAEPTMGDDPITGLPRNSPQMRPTRRNNDVMGESFRTPKRGGGPGQPMRSPDAHGGVPSEPLDAEIEAYMLKLEDPNTTEEEFKAILKILGVEEDLVLPANAVGAVDKSVTRAAAPATKMVRIPDMKNVDDIKEQVALAIHFDPELESVFRDYYTTPSKTGKGLKYIRATDKLPNSAGQSRLRAIFGNLKDNRTAAGLMDTVAEGLDPNAAMIGELPFLKTDIDASARVLRATAKDPSLSRRINEMMQIDTYSPDGGQTLTNAGKNKLEAMIAYAESEKGATRNVVLDPTSGGYSDMVNDTNWKVFEATQQQRINDLVEKYPDILKSVQEVLDYRNPNSGLPYSDVERVRKIENRISFREGGGTTAGRDARVKVESVEEPQMVNRPRKPRNTETYRAEVTTENADAIYASFESRLAAVEKYEPNPENGIRFRVEREAAKFDGRKPKLSEVRAIHAKLRNIEDRVVASAETGTAMSQLNMGSGPGAAGDWHQQWKDPAVLAERRATVEALDESAGPLFDKIVDDPASYTENSKKFTQKARRDLTKIYRDVTGDTTISGVRGAAPSVAEINQSNAKEVVATFRERIIASKHMDEFLEGNVKRELSRVDRDPIVNIRKADAHIRSAELKALDPTKQPRAAAAERVVGGSWEPVTVPPPRSVPFEPTVQGWAATMDDPAEAARRLGMLNEQDQKMIAQILDNPTYRTAGGKLTRAGKTALNRSWPSTRIYRTTAAEQLHNNLQSILKAQDEVLAKAAAGADIPPATGAAGGGEGLPPESGVAAGATSPEDPLDAARAKVESMGNPVKPPTVEASNTVSVDPHTSPRDYDNYLEDVAKDAANADPAVGTAQSTTDAQTRLLNNAAETLQNSTSEPSKINAILNEDTVDEDLINSLNDLSGSTSGPHQARIDEAIRLLNERNVILGAARNAEDAGTRAALAQIAEARRAEALLELASEAADKEIAAQGVQRLSAMTDAQRKFADALRDGTYKQLASDPNVALPREIVDALERVSRVTTNEGAAKFFKYYDDMVSWLKKWQVATPGFHIRNMMGGIFNNFLADVDIGATTRFRNAHASWLKGTLPQAEGEKMAALMEYMGGGGQYSAAELGGHSGYSMKPWSSKFAPIEGSARAGETVEFHLRGALGWDRMLKGASLDSALADIEKFHFNYANLSETERKMKRVIPFYTWTRYNLPLQAEMFIQSPGKYGRYEIFKNNVEELSAPDKVVPAFLQQDMFGIRMPFNMGDGTAYVTPDLPFTQTIANTMPDFRGFDPSKAKSYSGLANNWASMMTPIIKAPLELMKGEQFFKGLPMPRDYKKGDKPYGFNNTAGNAAGSFFGGNQKAAYLLEQLVPPYARARRLFPSEGKYQERRPSAIAGFLGAPVRTLSPTDIHNEKLRRQFEGSRRNTSR